MSNRLLKPHKFRDCGGCKRHVYILKPNRPYPRCPRCNSGALRPVAK